MNTLTQEAFASGNFASGKTVPEHKNMAPAALREDPPATGTVDAETGTGEEYEFVLGRRQVASLSFVVVVLIALFSGISYLAGKTSAPGKKDGLTRTAAPVTADSAPVLAAGLVVAPAPKSSFDPTIGSPGLPNLGTAEPSSSTPAAGKTALFAEPVAGAIYIQTGAVERGVATIMAEGLRAHGFNAFVASGPTDKVFRVLMGPFPSIDAYQSAKTTLDEIGLSAFSRQYHK